jgi:hypothetical protein
MGILGTLNNWLEGRGMTERNSKGSLRSKAGVRACRNCMVACIGLCLAVSVVTGCEADGQDGKGSSVKQSAFDQKLRDCGFLTGGPFKGARFDLVSNFEYLQFDADNPLIACEVQCLLDATCEELEPSFCDFDDPPASLSACIGLCTFACEDGSETIEQNRLCNGYSDCEDASDESSCGFFKCSASDESDLKPDESNYIPALWVCDEDETCSDGSDELGCEEFVCDDGSDTFGAYYVCDGEADCSDGSDEFGCATLCGVVRY